MISESLPVELSEMIYEQLLPTGDIGVRSYNQLSLYERDGRDSIDSICEWSYMGHDFLSELASYFYRTRRFVFDFSSNRYSPASSHSVSDFIAKDVFNLHLSPTALISKVSMQVSVLDVGLNTAKRYRSFADTHKAAVDSLRAQISMVVENLESISHLRRSPFQLALLLDCRKQLGPLEFKGLSLARLALDMILPTLVQLKDSGWTLDVHLQDFEVYRFPRRYYPRFNEEDIGLTTGDLIKKGLGWMHDQKI
jgi:hypothetical protein